MTWQGVNEGKQADFSACDKEDSVLTVERKERG